MERMSCAAVTVSSVLTKLQEKNPAIVGVRCVCHSIQLAASKAVNTMPQNIDYLVHQTYNWFSFSTARQTAYQQIFAAINNGATPLKIIAPSGTRWLSMYQCVNRILTQWDELKLHFQVAKNRERCYNAELLYQMYNDPVNKLYLQFLHPVLAEFNKINKVCQSESASCLKLFNDLDFFANNLLRRTVKQSAIQ